MKLDKELQQAKFSFKEFDATLKLEHLTQSGIDHYAKYALASDINGRRCHKKFL